MTTGFCIIGYGAWGSHHAAAVAGEEETSLIAIAANSDDSQARSRAAHPDAAVVGDYRELLARDDIDAVSIVLPNAMHEEAAVAAFEAGKHVLLEKPMATSVAACDRILAAKAAAGTSLSIAHELRLSSQWGQIKTYIDEGRLGEPLYLMVELWRRPYRSGSDDWRYDAGRVGSWMLEEIIHWVDFAGWYFECLGDPVSVSAAGSGKGRADGLKDNFSIMLRWQSGAYALLTQTVAGFENYLNAGLVGTKGSVRGEWSAAMDRSHTPTANLRLLDGLTGDERFDIGPVTDVPLAHPSGEVFELELLIRRFVDGLATGVPVVSGEEGRRAVPLCMAAEDAMRAGRDVAIKL